MQSSLYVALSAQVAMEKRLNTIANNVANMNTGGFRADEVKFEEVLSLAAKENVSFASSGEGHSDQELNRCAPRGHLSVLALFPSWFTCYRLAATHDGRAWPDGNELDR